MKFVWRYIRRKLNDIGTEREEDICVPTKLMAATSSDADWGDGLNIQVHRAQGGRIVTFRRYDRKTDRNNNSVYVIHDDLDFEKELGKLITLESMRG